MFKCEFEYDDMIVMASCTDVNEYNVYGLNVSYVIRDDEDNETEIDPEFDIDEDHEVKELLHSNLLDAKVNSDTYDKVS